jgi:spoIIIJ-associated protein
MKTIEVSARSVEEAKKIALEKLNIGEEDVDIDIIEEPSKGFLGILGGKLAKVKVTQKEKTQLVVSEGKVTLNESKKFLETVTKLMGAQTSINVQNNGEYIKMDLVGNDLGILIGRRGDTLDALQYLANIVANKNNDEERIRVIVDAEGYRERRKDTLTKLAFRMAEKVKRTGQRVIMEPMNPQERRIIHTALQSESGIQTLSEGEEPFRKVIISLNKK